MSCHGAGGLVRPVVCLVSSPVSPDGPPAVLLRGGASHEAEGRRGARGNGAVRVRAPAGRLRLLRQIRNELVPGVEQFLLVDDVVAVEDGAALVAGQEHGDPLGDSSQGCGVDAVSQFRADAKPPHVVGNNRGDALVALPRDACDVGRGENVLHPEKRMVRW